MADRPTNCPVCNKRLSRKQWYYRNGQYYCKKGCWEAAQRKAKEEAAAKSAAAQEKTASAQTETKPEQAASA